MTKSEIAEWILAQVLPPERAASTVGDWLEDIDKHGSTWFWSCVLRTVLSRIGNDFTESPRLVLVLALRSSAPATYLIVILSQILLPHFVPRSLWTLCALASVAWIAATGVVIGAWIARRAPGKEVAVCLSASLVPIIAIGLATLLLPRFRSGPSIAVQDGILCITLLAGALRFRHRQLHPVG